MRFIRTDKARDELQPGRRSLSQRERALLLLAGGQHSLTDFGALFGGGRDEAAHVAQRLVEQGYLAADGAAPAHRAPTEPTEPTEPAAPAAPEATPVAADPFDGKRSLATTRMFLFDLCERMFVRRDPPLAGRFRTALREARDRDAMLATAEAMLAEIARAAGDERAASVRERIERLLPAEVLH